MWGYVSLRLSDPPLLRGNFGHPLSQTYRSVDLQLEADPSFGDRKMEVLFNEDYRSESI